MTNRLYEIIRITYRDGTNRDEPDYMKRIGSRGELYYLEEGLPLMFQYTERIGMPYDGVLRTSKVENVDIVDVDGDNEQLIITTENSVFYLQGI